MSEKDSKIAEERISETTDTDQESPGEAKKTPKFIIFRVTPELYDRVATKAEEVGISVSRYMRKLAEGHHPKARMTKEQEDALNQLADARGELTHIRNALSGKTQQERLIFFHDADFMSWWIDATTKLIEDWLTIEHHFRHG